MRVRAWSANASLMYSVDFFMPRLFLAFAAHDRTRSWIYRDEKGIEFAPCDEVICCTGRARTISLLFCGRNSRIMSASS